ncbi:DUF393 domain-containing protein [Paraglaciecola aquimarina]|uniref:DUF393 domain-containing protein n=1 Tax=Paraglaciecola aquimarina TaxID=1235557 RepID=A0ABU3SYI5_9ALTE|nr:DUF393 domain-containing protein [Paraglaciecola aquimarina]MDU0355073.1 DUF393 domain-containing protein [Paraglaciecola aquimarina]
MLTIFYDGLCPLCSAEMRHLKAADSNKKIVLVDIQQQDFIVNYPDIDYQQATKILHGIYQGELLLGLAVTHRAWTLVGKGFWVAPLNWPVLKSVSHWIYLGIAKYRHPISRFLSRAFGLNITQCSSGSCYDKHNNRRQ